MIGLRLDMVDAFDAPSRLPAKTCRTAAFHVACPTVYLYVMSKVAYFGRSTIKPEPAFE
jgi:hypothetical protein